MNHRRYSTFSKTVAIILSVVFFCAALCSITAVAVMATEGFYNLSYQRVRQYYLSEELQDKLLYIAEYYKTNEENRIFYDDPIEYYEDTDFRFTVIDNQTGEIIAQSYKESETITFETDYTYYIYQNKPEDLDNESYEYDGTYKRIITITGFLIENTGDLEELFTENLNLISLGYRLRYPLLAVAFLSFSCFIILLIYLLFAAGRRSNREQAQNGICEKIPFDILTVVYAAAVTFLIMGLFGSLFQGIYILTLSVALFLAVTAYLITLLYFMSFATRIKTKSLIRTLLIYRISVWCIQKLSAFFRYIPVIWKTVIAMAAYLLLDILALFLTYDAVFFFIYWIIKNAIFGCGILYIAISLRKLQKGSEKIASGDLSYQIETKYLFGDLEGFAQTMNNIGNSMSIAVSERMKSEHLKTELITNVSHDIKTPLTSIINYVDLLKKEHLDNQTANEYLDILDHQSSRLKKLICDLVEVSKASTGNIQVQIEKCDICVLLQQAVGEYCEKLKNANLEVVTYISKLPITIMADGNLLWRVFDNLLGNICKYSLSGTRVYLDAVAQENQCVITFKNISKTPLGESCDELMERFVRGDHSRNTEGSGLGLSIAKSLLELQGGTIAISSDGDLFKAVIALPIKQ